MLGAVVRFGVIDIEEYHGSKGQGVMDEGDGQQSCKAQLTGRLITADSSGWLHEILGLHVCVVHSPANQHFVFPSSAFCSQDWLQE